MRRTPKEVRHRWYRRVGATLAAWACPACKVWTANLPLFKMDVCPARDRRKNHTDRRNSTSRTPKDAPR